MPVLCDEVVRRNNRHNRHALLLVGAAAAALGGCSAAQQASRTPSPTAEAFARAGLTQELPAPGMGTDPTYQPPSQFTVATLGAGDALGRAIYVHDVMLAAALRFEQRPVDRRPAMATVPVED